MSIRPDQFVGKTLLEATAISAIVGTRVYYGLRLPDKNGNIFPAINYYDLPGNRNAIKRNVYSINCRAKKIEEAKALSEKVLDLFVGENGFGTCFDSTAFSAFRVSLVTSHQVIPETESGVFNSPVDIAIVY